jgi:spermidine synthase
MKPRVKLAEAPTKDGSVMTLIEHDGDFAISFNGNDLMHSKASTSERALGTVGVARLGKEEPSRVLVGGLGLGLTLQSVLRDAGPLAEVTVVESMAELVDWNREFLKDLNGGAVDDPRVRIRIGDVTKVIKKTKEDIYDVILLDIDNGPIGMVTKKNTSLFSYMGVRFIKDALKPKGRAVFWSAGPDGKFEILLNKAGFRVKVVPTKVHERAKRAAYMLYVADNR